MNIVFMGTPTIALPTLDALASRHNVAAVFTRQDAVSHRGRQKLPSLVKARATELRIPSFTPRSFYASLDATSSSSNGEGKREVDASILSTIERSAPDLIVVVAYGMLLPAEVLALPTFGCLNIHASLLPRWRGAAPIQRALLAGDEQVGVSVMRMEADLDTGPYCLQASTPAKGKNYQQLIVEMGIMGAELLVENLEAIVAGTVAWVEQDESLVTYADKVPKGSIDLDSALTVFENHNRVRASSHHARCRTTLFGKTMMVLETRPVDETEEVSDKNVYFICSDGLLEVVLLKPDGGREMTGAALKAGLR